jgi:hypothetical protein
MTAAIIERFADAHGPLRALVVGEEWSQLYVSNFYEILTQARPLLQAEDIRAATAAIRRYWSLVITASSRSSSEFLGASGYERHASRREHEAG